MVGGSLSQLRLSADKELNQVFCCLLCLLVIIVLFSLLGMERIFENISCGNLGSGEDVSFPEVGIANFFFESANC